MSKLKKEPVLIIPSLVKTSDYGGITHQLELIERLSKKFNVSLVGSSGQGHKKITLPEVKGEEITGGIRLRYALKIIFSGIKTGRRKKVKLIYARHGLATVPAIMVGKILRKPVILEINGILSDEEGSNSWMLRKIDSMGSKHGASIITVTQGIKKHFIETYGADPDKITVVPNGANIDHFRPMDKYQARASLKLGQKEKTIVYIGILEQWQGLEVLIRATPTILKEWPDTNILIGGSGPMKNELMKLTKEMKLEKSVKFIGAIAYKDVPVYINAGDVCVAPKKPLKSGYSPLKLYEYMACGRPVIASNLRGFEILEQHNAGILFKPESSEELAQSINALLKDEKQQNEMGANGRKLVENNYSWDAVAQKVYMICMDTIKAAEK